MKLEIGMYVRTKEFGINRIKWFDNEEPILENGFTALQNSGYKSSPNIIDLIEEGDYVNGIYVDIIEKEQKRVWHVSCYGDEDIVFYNEDIKSIVTKEQFENCMYKVGD